MPLPFISDLKCVSVLYHWLLITNIVTDTAWY